MLANRGEEFSRRNAGRGRGSLTAVSLPGFEIDNGPPIGSFGLTPFAVAGCPRSLARPAEAMKRRWRLLCPSEKDLHHENIERMIGN